MLNISKLAETGTVPYCFGNAKYRSEFPFLTFRSADNIHLSRQCSNQVFERTALAGMNAAQRQLPSPFSLSESCAEQTLSLTDGLL